MTSLRRGKVRLNSHGFGYIPGSEFRAPVAEFTRQGQEQGEKPSGYLLAGGSEQTNKWEAPLVILLQVTN